MPESPSTRARERGCVRLCATLRYLGPGFRAQALTGLSQHNTPRLRLQALARVFDALASCERRA